LSRNYCGCLQRLNKTGFPKGLLTLWSGQGLKALAGVMWGVAPQTPPEALPLDSAKGILSLWKPDFD